MSLGHHANLSSINTSTIARPFSATIVRWYSLVLALSIFGVVNNGVILLIIIRKRSLRSGSGVLIANMVLTFFLMCACFAWTNLPVFLQDNGIGMPGLGCHYIMLVYVALITTAIWANVFLALNRFVAICMPDYYTAWTKNWVTFGQVIATWSVGILFGLLHFFDIGGSFARTPLGQCFFIGKGALGTTFLVLRSFAPYIISGLVVIAVLVKLRLDFARTRRVGVEKHVANQASIRQRRRRVIVANMLFISFGWEFICNTPIAILLASYSGLFANNPTLSLWIMLPLAGQFATNPLIFYATNSDYREGFRALFCKRKGAKVSSGETGNGSKRIPETISLPRATANGLISKSLHPSHHHSDSSGPGSQPQDKNKNVAH